MSQFNAEEYLKKMHTRELMSLRKSMFKMNCIERPFNANVLTENDNWYITMEQVKAELSTRENIPNKKEAKIIRQQKAKKN